MVSEIQPGQTFSRPPARPDARPPIRTPYVVLITQWGQHLPEIALSVTVFETNKFSISTKIQDGGQNLEKSKFFRDTI